MNKIGTAGMATLILDGISIVTLFVSIVGLYYLKPYTINHTPMPFSAESIGIMIFLGMAVVFVFYVVSAVTSLTYIRFHIGNSIANKLSLFVGLLSCVLLFGEIGLLNDIFKESSMGWDVGGEWAVLQYILIPQILYHILVVFTVLSAMHKERESAHEATADDTVFYTVHSAGVLCGLMGISMMILLFSINMSHQNLKFIILYYNILIVFPYMLLALYWLFMKLKTRMGEWYDEKQQNDIARAGFITFLFSLPVLGIFYGMHFFGLYTQSQILWFPIYFHVALTVFSGYTLFLKYR